MATADLLQRVLRSVFFKAAQKKAAAFAGNRVRLLYLLGQVAAKMTRVSSGSGKAGFAGQLKTLSRMVKAYQSGRYRAVSWATVLKVVAVLIYFVSPVDFMPDLLPVVGFADDMALVAWVYQTVAEEVAKFEGWEANQPAAQ